MNQKTIAKVPLDSSDLTQENLNQDCFQPRTRVTDLKSLGQAMHNIGLAFDLLDIADTAYEEIEAILGQIKQLATPGLAKNLDPSLRSSLNINILLKKSELDQFSASVRFKGKKILDGSLSASRNAEQHFYLMAGVTGSPENRINLNTGLNIPKISSKTMGLGTAFFKAPEEGFKTIMVLENALGIIHRLKQRSLALRTLLQKIKNRVEISLANHQAAESAPESLATTEEILRAINNHSQKR